MNGIKETEAKEHGTEVWIGLAHVVPTFATSFLSDYDGAYVNALALSNSRDEFLARVTSAFEDDLKVNVDGVEDIEPLAVRRFRGEIDPKIDEIAGSLTRDHPVDFDDFQFYLD
jgi:hypothetical protein